MGYLYVMHPPNRIRELRKAAGLTQADLGEKLNLSSGQVSHIENGIRNLTLEWMKRFAKALNVSVAELLTDEDNPDRLGDAERRMIEALRNATPEARRHIQAMTEAVSYSDKKENKVA